MSRISILTLSLALPACTLTATPATAADSLSPAPAAADSLTPAAAAAATQELPATMQEMVAQYQADVGTLERVWSFPFSAAGHQRMVRLRQDWLQSLDAYPYDLVRRPSKIDWHLLRNRVAHDLHQAEIQARRDQEATPLVTFAPPLIALLDARARRQPADARAASEVLAAAVTAVEDLRSALHEQQHRVDAPVANRVAGQVQQLRRSLGQWMRYGEDYDPVFTWWCMAPWEALSAELEEYATFVRSEVGGIRSNDPDQLIGDPIGREALLAALAAERLPYGPERLIEIAEREFAWCLAERQKAAAAMGLGQDWKAAQEQVKQAHPGPGGQPAVISMLAEEAVAFLEERDLLTIPELAKECWRMDMMSPQRQKFTPYFTGGEVISISYPTEGMAHEDKMMSMRGNNLHYSRATVHHELIPGHHLQGYMAQRWNPHRRSFSTPFLVEGWALYWEMRLWDLGFPKSPEDRIGMLFWRSHRCARIIFSLNFHLGKWSPEECIDFLVERVGHERRNATAEVRRSIQGGYGPLYQAAYMLGGLQLRALHDELVVHGNWSEKSFHDAVLRQNSIPIEYLRQALLDTPLPKEFPVSWHFDG